MRRTLWIGLVLLLSALGMEAQTVPTQAVFNWSYTFNTAYPVPCTATVTTNCIQNFLLTQGGTTVATIPATTATAYGYTLTTLPAAGTYTYTLVAIGAYQGGTIPSSPLMVSLQIPSTVAAPNTFTVVLH